jgi:ribose transport system substrate-binding protein
MTNGISRRSFLGSTALIGGATLLSTPLLAGCRSDSADAGGAKAVQQVPTVENPYWAQWKQGGTEAAAALGISFRQQSYDSSAETQLTQVERASTSQLDMITMYALSAAQSPQLIRSAASQKVYVANAFSNQAWSTPFESGFEDYYALYIQSQTYAGAVALAASVFKQMNGEGEVIVLLGPEGSSVTTERQKGIQDAAKQFPGIRIVAEEAGGDNQVVAQPKFDSLFTAHPDAKGVVCFNDGQALGVLASLQSKGAEDVKVGGFDAVELFLDALIKGPNAAASCAIHGGWTGGFALVRAFDIMQGVKVDPLERLLFQDCLIIDTPEAATKYTEVMYKADKLPFDWKKMSIKLNPDSWDPQLAVRPADPDELWAYEAKPDGYQLPSPMQASIDAGNLQTIGQKYFSMAKARPLDEVTKLTTAQKGVLEAP